MRRAVLAAIVLSTTSPMIVAAQRTLPPPAVVDLRKADAAQSHMRKGDTLMRIERFSDAVAEYRRAVAFDPLLALADFQLGRAHMALRQYGAAVEALLACRDAYRALAMLAANEGRSGVEPPEVALTLGSAYFHTGALDEAEREYRAAIRGRPSFGEAHNNLAIVLMKRGRLDDARRELERAEASGYRVAPGLKQQIAAR